MHTSGTRRESIAQKSTSVHSGQESPQVSTRVLDSPTKSTEGEGEGEVKKHARNGKPSAECVTLYQAYPRHVAPLSALIRTIAKAVKVKPFDDLLPSRYPIFKEGSSRSHRGEIYSSSGDLVQRRFGTTMSQPSYSILTAVKILAISSEKRNTDARLKPRRQSRV